MLKSKKKGIGKCSGTKVLCWACVIGIFTFCITVFILSLQTQTMYLQLSYKSTSRLGQSVSYMSKSHKYDQSLHSTQNEIYNEIESIYLIKSRSGIDIYDILAGTMYISGHISSGSFLIGSLPFLPSNYTTTTTLLHCETMIFTKYPHRGWICIPPSPVAVIVAVTIPHLSTVENKENMEKCTNFQFIDVDLPGGDLPNMPIQSTSTESCCEECSLSKLCNSWTMTSSGECWLKKIEDSLFKTIVKPGLISGRLKKKNTVSNDRDNHHPLELALINSISNRLPSCCLNRMKDSRLLGNTTTLETIRLGSEESHVNLWELRLERKSIGWNEQWPIGNGKFGALVGGVADSEVIPISIAGLFAKSKLQNNNNNQQQHSKDDSRNILYKAFIETRELLMNGSITKAHKRASDMIDHSTSLGMFQYVADLTFLFSFDDMTFIDSSKQSSNQPNSVHRILVENNNILKSNPKSGPIQISKLIFNSNNNRNRIIRPPIRQGREGLVDLLHSHINISSSLSSSSSSSKREMKTLYSSSSLDMKNGITTTQIIGTFSPDKSSMDHRESSTYLMRREWFASEVDDVIVGKISAYQTDILEDTMNEGFSFAMRLSRDHNQNMPIPTLQSSIESMEPMKTEDESQRLFKFHMTIQSNDHIDIPNVSVCGIIRCYRFSDDTHHHHHHDQTYEINNKDIKDSNLILCNRISSAEIYLSILMNNPNDIDESENFDISKQLAQCYDKILMVFELGYDNLRNRHRKLFSSRMSKVNLEFNSMNVSNTCPMSSIDSRLRSFKEGCLESISKNVDNSIDSLYSVPINTITSNSTVLNDILSKSTRTEGIDLNLIVQSYQYGKYLLYSSSTRSVSNLQGIWADGSVSAWNGDYHLNINLQQIYWPAGIANIKEVIHPLIDFLLLLSGTRDNESVNNKGKINKKTKIKSKTSKELYGCQSLEAWVAHGFTDNTMNGGILGDTQWALCVTCGAWLATQVFDQILFSDDYQYDGMLEQLFIDKLLPVFRGIASFFMGYMIIKDNVSFTGPSTSPENSYRIIKRMDSLLDQEDTIESQHQQNIAILDIKTSVKVIPKINSKLNLKDFIELIGHLTMSTGLDCSVLRQVSNVLMLSIGWLASSNDPYVKSYMETSYEDDLNLAIKFQELIRMMPEAAMPKIGKHGRILEYPAEFLENTAIGNDFDPNTFSQSGIDSLLDESMDPGHRHFSGMHWLYPNAFHTSYPTLQQDLYLAAKRTLDKKRLHRGGHTSWSAAWEACLYARLGYGEEAMDAISRILIKYSASNMLSLHPPLIPDELKECGTCFTELDFTQYGVDHIASLNRGLVTATDFKFQLDGNLGLVAAISEMLVQSHRMGSIYLLPALPTTMMASGKISGLKARGSAEVSIIWFNRKLQSAKIHFLHYHPWYGEYIEPYPGFYSYNQSSKESKTIGFVEIVSNSNVRLYDRIQSTCVEWIDSTRKVIGSNHINLQGYGDTIYIINVRIVSYPCTVVLCADRVRTSECDRVLTS